MKASHLRIGAAALVLGGTAAGQGSCPVPSYGKTCGPVLAGTVRLDGKNRRIEMVLTKGFPSAIGFTVGGDRKLSVPFPGTACFLNTNLLVMVPFATDARGAAKHATVFPYGASLLTYVQDIVVRPRGGRLDIASSNGLQLGPWVRVRETLEDFKSTRHVDCDASSAAWTGDGTLRSARLGGTGCLGDFDGAAGGKNTGKRDAKGRTIFEWNTDRTVIPASRTLSGRAITVTNGVFEFRSFTVRANQHVRFVGSKAPARSLFASRAIWSSRQAAS